MAWKDSAQDPENKRGWCKPWGGKSPPHCDRTTCNIREDYHQHLDHLVLTTPFCKVEITDIPKLQGRKLRLREVSQVSKLVRGDTGNQIGASLENRCSLLLETSWGRVREQMASGLEAVLMRGGSPTLLDTPVAHRQEHCGCLLAKLHLVTHFHCLREQQTRRRLLNLLPGVTHVTSVHISLGRQVIWPDLLLELGKLAHPPRVHARPKAMPASLVAVEVGGEK